MVVSHVKRQAQNGATMSHLSRLNVKNERQHCVKFWE